MKKLLSTFLASAALGATDATAQTTFQASLLDGSNEQPPNTSLAIGAATVTLNPAQTQITVDLDWAGLTGPATAAHIHGPAGAGTNAAVLFSLTGVPSATSGSIPEQTFAISPAQVAYLFAGYLYVDVHTPFFPGGEIRDQLLLAGTPPPCSQTNAVLGIVRNTDNTHTISLVGTYQAQYYLLSQTNVTQPITNWIQVPGSFNTVTSASGLWSVVVTNRSPAYYRSKAVYPCP